MAIDYRSKEPHYDTPGCACVCCVIDRDNAAAEAAAWAEDTAALAAVPVRRPTRDHASYAVRRLGLLA